MARVPPSHQPVVFGEQVASKYGLAWFDLVQAGRLIPALRGSVRRTSARVTPVPHSVTFDQKSMSCVMDECWRVLKPGGTLIFKWAEDQVKLKEVLACFPQKPVFGHTTTKNLKTHWITFYKRESNS